jgi:hypothetical protein
MASEGAFAVHHLGKVGVVTGDPAIRPELAQCLGILPRAVGRQPDGLPHTAESAAASTSRQGVLERELWIDLEQAAGHDQVLGHPGTIALVQGVQFATGRPIQFLAGDILVDLR